jgi:peptidoglycan/LPS O-acetylase OafA/YrhL
VASVLIYFSARLFPDRPAGVPRLVDMIPGLLFVGQELCAKLLRTQLYLPEGSFWSLFVEVKFYIFFGFLWFVRTDKAITIFTIMYIVSSLYHIVISIEPDLALVFPSNGVLRVLNHIVLDRYYGWFAVGAIFYRQWKRTRWNYTVHSLSEFILLMFLIVLSIIDLNKNFSVVIPALLIVALFWLALFNRHVAGLLSRQPFAFMGFISYPLYLIHENAMVSLTIKTHQFFPTMPGMLTPIPGLMLISLVAWLIAGFGEPRLREMIRAGVGVLRKSP